MDRLLELVLLLAITTGCYSYVYKRNEPEIETPPQVEIDDDYYPKEYMERLLAKLKPEELDHLLSVVDLQHRVATPSSARCSTYKHNYIPNQACDEFGICYYVSHIPDLQLEVEVCNHTLGHECEVQEYEQRPSYGNCCRQVKDRVLVIANSVPVQILQRSYFMHDEKDSLTEKELYVNSRCECISQTLDKQDIGNAAEVCKRPANDNNV